METEIEDKNTPLETKDTEPNKKEKRRLNSSPWIQRKLLVNVELTPQIYQLNPLSNSVVQRLELILRNLYNVVYGQKCL